MAKKRKKAPEPRNLVAKHAGDFNVARVFKDKKNDYSRKGKSRHQRDFFCSKFAGHLLVNNAIIV